MMVTGLSNVASFQKNIWIGMSMQFTKTILLKKLKCHDSNIGFLRKDHLERHILIVHEGEKSFKCVTCDNSFTSKQD